MDEGFIPERLSRVSSRLVTDSILLVSGLMDLQDEVQISAEDLEELESSERRIFEIVSKVADQLDKVVVPGEVVSEVPT